jgi:hypothetical protein
VWRVAAGPNAPNTVPHVESFEPYAAGTDLPGVNGWYADTVDALTVRAESYVHTNRLLTGEDHTKVGEFVEAGVSNLYRGTGGWTNLWIDFIVQPQLSDKPGTLNRVQGDADTQWAIYFDASGRIHLYHGWYEADWTPRKGWTILDYPPVASGQWVRVTLTMDYLTDVWLESFPPDWPPDRIDQYFRIAVDGGDPVSDALAYQERDPTSGGNGTWFLCAHTPHAEGFGSTNLSGICLLGPGKIDDLVVNTNAASPSSSSLSPYEQWLAAEGVEDGADDDDDGAESWDEYLAGTDPNDQDSVFRIIEIKSGSPKTIVFFATDANDNTPFDIYRATNLLDVSPWQMVDTGVARDPSGTNVWVDTAAPPGQAYYLPAIPYEE